MKSTLLVLSIAASVSASASANLVYTQNFDSMGATAQSITGTGAINAQGVIAGLDGSWQAARIAGTNTSALTATSDSGTNNSGGIYNYAQPNSDPDRALGSIASAGITPAFGAAIVNNLSYSLDSITISFDAMMFRSSTTTVNKLVFAYGFSSGVATSSTFLSSAGMNADTRGDVVGGAPVTTNGAVNPATSTSVTFTITGITWAAGETLFLRWQDSNETGNDAGLAVDNFSLTAVPTPGAMALLGLAGVVAGRRRS